MADVPESVAHDLDCFEVEVNYYNLYNPTDS